jgi:hypothetical protein
MPPTISKLRLHSITLLGNSRPVIILLILDYLKPVLAIQLVFESKTSRIAKLCRNKEVG